MVSATASNMIRRHSQNLHGLDHFIIDSLKKWILEAADCWFFFSWSNNVHYRLWKSHNSLTMICTKVFQKSRKHFIMLLKLIHCEKTTKFEKISRLFWHLLSKVKPSGIFFQIFVACLEKNNWLNDFPDTVILKKNAQISFTIWWRKQNS